MRSPLRQVTIRGFKSIESLNDFPLQDLNVLIGANGAGKTNFVDFFRLLRAMSEEGLQKFVNDQGNADGFFFLGPKHTPEIHVHLELDWNIYEFTLTPTATGTIQISKERVRYTGGSPNTPFVTISSGAQESSLKKKEDQKSPKGNWPSVSAHVYEAVSSWTVYHFHDTSMLAPMRRDQSARDFERLRADAANIAAFLLHMRSKSPSSYDLIRDTIRLIAPFFDDFLLRPEDKGGEEKVRLEWRQKGSDFPFQPIHLSDGTIRFACLATALLQPDPPSTIVIDEPELGLHPYAIALLAELIHSAAKRTQVLISTQSATLLDHFEPDEIVVVNRSERGASTFERLEPAKLASWLEEYSVGELWQKNVVRGGPTGA
jgi:predicted ATPase